MPEIVEPAIPVEYRKDIALLWVLCRVDGSGGKFLISIGPRWFGPEKVEYDVSCRSADPFKGVAEHRAVAGYGKNGLPDLETALAYANGDGESPLSSETRPATAGEVAGIPCFSPSTKSQPNEIVRPGPEVPSPAEALGLPPVEEIRELPGPVADAYRKFVASLKYIGTENEVIFCDSNPFYVTRWNMPKDENLSLLEILFANAPGILAVFREEIIEEYKEDIEPVPEDAGEEWVAVAKVGVHDDDYVAHLVPMPLGFIRTDRFLKGLCRLFNDHNYAWSGATPYLGEVHASQGPWGKIGKTEFALAVACGYADMFGRGPWHNGDICRWSEARLRRVAGELSRAGVDPLELVHVVYMGRE